MNVDIVKGTNIDRYLSLNEDQRFEIGALSEKKNIELESEVNDFDDVTHTIKWVNVAIEDGLDFISIGSIIK